MDILLMIISSFLLCCSPNAKVEAYRNFSSDSEQTNFCMYKNHFIVNPTITCCNSSVFNSGINLEEHWEKCAVPQESAENAQTAAWEVYSCILKEYNGDGNSISLTKFAELVTGTYPQDFKDKIVEEIGSLGDVTADFSDYKSVDKLRVSYYDVEKEVCSEMASGTKDYGKVRSCTSWDEEFHRGGKCCGLSSYPFDIGFKSLMGEDLVQKTEPCNLLLNSTILKKYNLTDMGANSVAEICDLSCEMIEKGIITPTDLDNNNYLEIDYINIIKQLLPSWLPAKVQNEAYDFARQKFNYNNTVERINNFEYADGTDKKSIVFYTGFINETKNADNTTKTRDFIRRKLPGIVLHVPITCSIHSELMSLSELYLYTKNCDSSPDGTVETPAEENSESATENSPPAEE